MKKQLEITVPFACPDWNETACKQSPSFQVLNVAIVISALAPNGVRVPAVQYLLR
jgi:hypothetical protein